jgi:hypothetical protein
MKPQALIKSGFENGHEKIKLFSAQSSNRMKKASTGEGTNVLLSIFGPKQFVPSFGVLMAQTAASVVLDSRAKNAAT